MGTCKIAIIIGNKDSLFNQFIIRNKIEGRYCDYFDQYFYRATPDAPLEVIR